MMDSQQLSLLSSLKEELKPEDYIQPHYKEAYRLAIDSLVNDGRESYQEFLKSERIGSFLSEDEIHFITTNASQPLPSNHTEEIDGPGPDAAASKSSTGTYWPVDSDIATPDLELGWPEVMPDRLQTNINLFFHPPRLNRPTIKEVIRKHIQDARQTISVSVSVLTLSCIALDRWYAICHPLMFKSTARRARKSILLIWGVSCVIMIPQAIVMECSSLLPELTNKTSLFTVCEERWGADVYPKVYHTCFFIVTYFAPLCLMVLAYIQICHKLWCQQIPGTSSVLQRKRMPLQGSTYSPGPGESAKVRTSTVSAEIKQVRARRKTARMLMVVLFVFALCYLPISVLNIMKRVFGTFKYTNSRETVYAWFTFSHWLIYANSAANPIIYNFLSGKFRAEFKAAFSCRSFGRCQNQTEGIRRRINTDSRKSLSTQVNNMDNVSRISDHVV